MTITYDTHGRLNGTCPSTVTAVNFKSICVYVGLLGVEALFLSLSLVPYFTPPRNSGDDLYPNKKSVLLLNHLCR